MDVNFEDVINKPVAEVFEAIVNPTHMAHYFISGADSPLVAGHTVNWEFADVGATVAVKVIDIQPDKHIVLEWHASGADTRVEISLSPLKAGKTAINITESGWPMDEAGVAKALQQAIGWTDFCCCLKAYLLFGVNLRAGIKVS
jgi:uncharacterized protein YndB with AHSA1/START domain